MSLRSADIQGSSLDIDNIEIRTALKGIIAHDEYQVFQWDRQWVCLGFLLKHTVSADKRRTCTALDISTIRPLKIKNPNTAQSREQMMKSCCNYLHLVVSFLVCPKWKYGIKRK
jgi:hypothetical protein